MDCKENTFLVTGGASGLGAATAQMFAAQGANVVVADLRPPAGDRTAVHFVQTDVTDPESVASLVEQVRAEFGGLRGVVHCAGVLIAKRVLGRSGPHSLDDFRRVVEVNLIGIFNVNRLAAQLIADQPPLEDGERGVIVQTASVAAFDGQIGQAAYAASKGGVAAMTLPVAREFAQFGIRVVTIAPGIFDTPMMASLPQAARDSLGKQVPFPPRLGLPQEYAELVGAIVRNRMLNGEVIRLDGAIRMGAR